MGLINFGIPEKESDIIKEIMGLNIFVEGGTFKGDTAKSMSNKFLKVFTIENSDKIFNEAKQNLKGISNITLLKGDTRKHLKEILDNNDNILFWLDAHWSGGDTYGQMDECPLIEELNIIFNFSSRNLAILIDDARLFLAPPASPHNFRNWPSIKQILNSIPDDWSCIVYEDVIYLYPIKIEDELKSSLQKEITQKSHVINFLSFLKRVAKLPKRVFKKLK